MASRNDPAAACGCAERPDWARIEDDDVMRWPAIDIGEWEELRQCPECDRAWLAVWPEEGEGPPILCRVRPAGTRRLRELDRPATLRPYCVARLAEHLGEIKESKASCRKVNCDRRRLLGSSYCVEHLIAEQFGRSLARLDEVTPAPTK